MNEPLKPMSPYYLIVPPHVYEFIQWDREVAHLRKITGLWPTRKRNTQPRTGILRGDIVRLNEHGLMERRDKGVPGVWGIAANRPYSLRSGERRILCAMYSRQINQLVWKKYRVCAR